jgi:folate-binding protein YgfZ
MTEIEQYEALRAGRGFVELADWSCVTVTGADRQTFLNNFCTNDVKKLSPGESCEAFFTNVKGKIIGHGLVVCDEAKIDFIGPPGQAAALAAHLDRYVIREDAHPRDATSELIHVLVTGDAAVSQPGTVQWRLLGELPCGFRQANKADQERLHDSLSADGLLPCGLSGFNTLRIEAGTPLFGIDFDDRNFPQEVGRDRQAISFTKGCYLGQETVARIDALGHVNQQLAGVKFDGAEVPPAGAELTSGSAVAGHVTSATHSPKLNAPLALAMIRRGHQTIGSRLESQYGACEVVALPL